jgi:hypothetical protein
MVEDSGRARTYQQSLVLDVKNAAMVGICMFITSIDFPACCLALMHLNLPLLHIHLLNHLRMQGLSCELHALHVIQRAERNGGILQR